MALKSSRQTLTSPTSGAIQCRGRGRASCGQRKLPYTLQAKPAARQRTIPQLPICTHSPLRWAIPKPTSPRLQASASTRGR